MCSDSEAKLEDHEDDIFFNDESFEDHLDEKDQIMYYRTSKYIAPSKTKLHCIFQKARRTETSANIKTIK